jgi:hypothetical protein
MRSERAPFRADGVATLVVAALVVLVATAGVVTAAGSTTVSITSRTDTVDVSETTTFEVVLESADGGVGVYSLDVALSDPSVATITGVEFGGSPNLTESNVEAGSANVRAARADTADTGPVTVLTVTVRGKQAGSTNLSVTVNALGDEQGIDYDVTGTSGASLTVSEANSASGGGDAPDRGGGGGSALGEDPSGEVEVVDATLLNETVATDAGVVARVDLANNDPVRGTVSLNLTANGSTVTERSVAVAASTERTVFLRHEFDRPGTYEVSVNGVALGAVSVTAEATPTRTGTTTPGQTTDSATVSPNTTTDDTVTPADAERPETAGDGDRSPSARDGSGFGLFVTVVSVLVSGLLLRRV